MSDITRPPSRAAERVSRILELMLEDKWRRGESAAEVAQESGVTKGTVEQEAAVVSHCIRALSGGGTDRVLKAINDRVDAIVRRFEASSDPAESKVALDGLRDLAKNYGYHARPQTRGAPDPDGESPDAAREYFRELLREPPPWLADMLASLGWIRLESPGSD